MVWGLIPVDSPRGAQKYYIFSRGTYKVGRKDCDIIVQTDTSVSRVHAEIVVDKMTSYDASHIGSGTFPSYARIIDRSRYGTSVNKELGADGVCLRKDLEAKLKDGDLVTFGTGNATFRFCFVPLVIFLHCSKPIQANHSLEASISSIGAHISCTWSNECTHVLVDESSPVTLELIEAILSKKPIVLSDWCKVLAEQKICIEIPSWTSYIPSLTIDGMLVRVVEPKSREKCLADYTFVLGSSHKYKFGDKFRSLLEVAGAKSFHVDEFCSNSQTSADGENNQVVLVIPGEPTNEFDHFRELSSLSRVTEVRLVAAILSGHLESSIIEPPACLDLRITKDIFEAIDADFLASCSNNFIQLHIKLLPSELLTVIISSSHSTDETMVADSDVEIDTATSDRAAAIANLPDALRCEHDEIVKESENREDVRNFEDTPKNVNYSLYEHEEKNPTVSEDGEETRDRDDRNNCTKYSVLSPDKSNISGPKFENVGVMKRVDKSEEAVADRHENSDIIYSQDLIVKNIGTLIPVRSTTKKVVNFKCFRKRNTMSGNSFRNLIPFSKDPYLESGCGSNESSEYMKEEKKRKQMEAIAEDLFNNEKVRKRATACTSLQALLSRR
uniref:Nijmegen breakage syndrome 1 protein isoform X2 n=1 Tax=Elaeis guineensis var. tenera TaxID=51953 RepID=A0A6I9R696_ELAGV|nr:nijmegen breakage syndrome 1 protein isoform X2 [Elaeis guineensis]